MEQQLDLTRMRSTEECQWLKIIQSNTIGDFIARLSNFPCNRCDLSKRNNHGVVIYKGSLDAKIMLVGEAPGKVEDEQHKAFIGPAGELQDKIFKAVGISTLRDMYLGNICKCRPTARPETGRQNDTPEKDQTFYCKPYILREIELLDPRIVVAVGKVAAVTLYGFEEKTLMKHVVGRFFQSNIQVLKGRELFIIYHPAAILHATGEKKTSLKKDIWEQVKKIRAKVDELGLKLHGA